MSYASTLAKIVTDSGLTLRELADKCKERGVPIDPSYISKLQTGKQGPGSEDISRAIADVCGIDPDTLLLEGYMDKAPTLIRDFVFDALTYLKQIAVSSFELLSTKEVASQMLDYLNKLPMIEFMSEVKSLLSSSSSEVPFPMGDPDAPQAALNPTVSIPVADNSMAPLIPQGAKANLMLDDSYDTGDIAVITLPDDTLLIRRLVYQDEKVFLIPENKQNEVLCFPIQQVKIIGRVKSITTDI